MSALNFTEWLNRRERVEELIRKSWENTNRSVSWGKFRALAEADVDDLMEAELVAKP